MANQVNRLSYYSKNFVQWAMDSLHRPKNFIIKLTVEFQTKLKRLYRERNKTTRRIGYNYDLLPNPFLAKQESQTKNSDEFIEYTGYSVGYSAWNLLYYNIYSSLHFTDERAPIIIETGTNQGYSTIVMAQVLRDLNIKAKIISVEYTPANAEIARKNIAEAGLTDYVEIHVQDAVQFLKDFVSKHDHIDFVFLDDDHSYQHVRKEFDIIYKSTVACNGKVYLDNIASGGVGRVLKYIRRACGGNIVEFLVGASRKRNLARLILSKRAS